MKNFDRQLRKKEVNPFPALLQKLDAYQAILKENDDIVLACIDELTLREESDNQVFDDDLLARLLLLRLCSDLRVEKAHDEVFEQYQKVHRAYGASGKPTSLESAIALHGFRSDLENLRGKKRIRTLVVNDQEYNVLDLQKIAQRDPIEHFSIIKHLVREILDTIDEDFTREDRAAEDDVFSRLPITSFVGFQPEYIKSLKKGWHQPQKNAFGPEILEIAELTRSFHTAGNKLLNTAYDLTLAPERTNEESEFLHEYATLLLESIEKYHCSGRKILGVVFDYYKLVYASRIIEHEFPDIDIKELIIDSIDSKHTADYLAAVYEYVETQFSLPDHVSEASITSQKLHLFDQLQQIEAIFPPRGMEVLGGQIGVSQMDSAQIDLKNGVWQVLLGFVGDQPLQISFLLWPQLGSVGSAIEWSMPSGFDKLPENQRSAVLEILCAIAENCVLRIRESREKLQHLPAFCRSKKPSLSLPKKPGSRTQPDNLEEKISLDVEVEDSLKPVFANLDTFDFSTVPQHVMQQAKRVLQNGSRPRKLRRKVKAGIRKGQEQYRVRCGKDYRILLAVVPSDVPGERAFEITAIETRENAYRKF